MKRTISTEASAAAAHLRGLGISIGPGFTCAGSLDPLTVLGCTPQSSWPEVRRAYVARLHVLHPERQPQDFMAVVEAYDFLKRYFRASPDTTAAAEAGDSCSGAPAKRRRADAAGASHASSGSVAPTFAGLQECWPAVATPAPVIALDPAGVGHIGRRPPQGGPLLGYNTTAAPVTFGSGCSNSAAMADDDDGGLTRAVSNHGGSGGFGGMMGAPLNARARGQPISAVCGVNGHGSLFSDADTSAMMIG